MLLHTLCIAYTNVHIQIWIVHPGFVLLFQVCFLILSNITFFVANFIWIGYKMLLKQTYWLTSFFVLFKKDMNAKPTRRKPKSCFRQVFNFKLGCFIIMQFMHFLNARPHPELNSLPRFCLVISSMSMEWIFKWKFSLD